MSQAFKRHYRVEDDTQSHNQDRSSWSAGAGSATDNCIIQCPSCQTRFSLPLSALADQSDPRFHCSQCDTIFRVENEETRPAPKLVETPVAASALDPMDSDMMPSSFDEPKASSSPLIYETVDTDEIPMQQPQIITPDEPVRTSPQSLQSKSFEIPKSVQTTWSMGAPHESAQREIEDMQTNTRPAAKDLLSRDSAPTGFGAGAFSGGFGDIGHKPVEPAAIKITTQQMDLDLESPAKKLSSQEMTFGRADKDAKVAPSEHDALRSSTLDTFPGRKTKRKQKSTPKPPPAAAKKGEVSIQKRQLLLESVKRLRINIPLGRWQAPLIIAGPLLTFCAVLFCLSIVLKADPLHSEEMLNSVVPGLPRVAPPGLAVVEARLRKLTLDSGDTIYALSGAVKNNSGKQLNQIHLDGLVFDKNGAMIKEKQVLVSSPLAQSKIKSLSLEMIEDIEANASKGKTSVKDGESAPFVVTFLPSEVSGARYFSTRINSIK